MLLNLLANAIKFARPGDRVTIAVAYEGGGALHISVVDTGPGMAPDGAHAPCAKAGGQPAAARREGAGLGLGPTADAGARRGQRRRAGHRERTRPAARALPSPSARTGSWLPEPHGTVDPNPVVSPPALGPDGRTAARGVTDREMRPPRMLHCNFCQGARHNFYGQTTVKNRRSNLGCIRPREETQQRKTTQGGKTWQPRRRVRRIFLGGRSRPESSGRPISRPGSAGRSMPSISRSSC